jgi:hypothetical protein
LCRSEPYGRDRGQHWIAPDGRHKHADRHADGACTQPAARQDLCIERPLQRSTAVASGTAQAGAMTCEARSRTAATAVRAEVVFRFASRCACTGASGSALRAGPRCWPCMARANAVIGSMAVPFGSAGDKRGGVDGPDDDPCQHCERALSPDCLGTVVRGRGAATSNAALPAMEPVGATALEAPPAARPAATVIPTREGSWPSGDPNRTETRGLARTVAGQRWASRPAHLDGMAARPPHTEAVTPMSTIPMAPHTTQLTRANRLDVVAPRCWCGQDLEYVKGVHCPRCGTPRGPLGRPLALAG